MKDRVKGYDSQKIGKIKENQVKMKGESDLSRHVTPDEGYDRKTRTAINKQKSGTMKTIP
jgi:hypothetical protein